MHKLLRVAQPHVRTMRQTGNRNQLREGRGFGLLDHAAYELGAELGYGQTAEVAQDRVGVRIFTCVFQCLARMEQAHGIRVVERDLLCIDAG